MKLNVLNSVSGTDRGTFQKVSSATIIRSKSLLINTMNTNMFLPEFGKTKKNC